MRKISWYSVSATGVMMARTFLREFQLAHGGIGAQFRETHLARQAFESAQVGDQTFAVVIVRIGIGIPRNFGQSVERALRRRVITKHAVTVPHQLELTQSVRACAGAPPHLFALYEKSVPVVGVRVHAEKPVVALGWCGLGRCGDGVMCSRKARIARRTIHELDARGRKSDSRDAELRYVYLAQ